MNSSRIRHELSLLETNIRVGLSQLLAQKQLEIDSKTLSLSALIEQMSASKLTCEPLFTKLTQLDAALCQLDIGLYGLCADCESEIEASRLMADPLEQRCAECAANHAHEHRQELRLNY
ncbi:TraR/DksA C4-type zinc finger protein [Shewanella sp. AS1]|uniref:TraR/DksA family transcriptional regulator n=1 Tax=Shewanella sp. AS1 TaxID=2907626 RepID=UPI001F2BF24F|nr:TraR/DksA C4-type zinc finger protein [Shewanella sp. AS1]MCE9678655.1 TraR/DksA C4-type zinc finger protein [Shewanella sp. AS1]